MARTLSPVAAVAATALLAIASGTARADTGLAAPESAQATPTPQTGTPSGGGATAPQDASTLTGPHVPPPPPEQVPQSPTAPAPPDPPPTTSSSVPVNPPAPPPPATPGAPPTQRLTETPPAPQEQAPGQKSASAASASGPGPSSEQAPEPTPAAPTPPATTSKPAPVAPVSAAAAATQPGAGVERLLTEVGRRLRTVQGQIDDLRHRIDRRAPAPPNRLTDVRASLVRIGPMLVALEASLDAAGRLTPDLRQLLHSVRSDLRGVSATAAGLASALKHSGARGPAVRLLLQEIEHFRALGSALIQTPPAGPVPAHSPGRPVSAPASFATGVAPGYSGIQPAAPTSAAPAPAPSLDRGSGDHSRTEPGGGGRSEQPAPPPWSAAPGPATASPGGTFLFAAVAALTMLLIASALPALGARLDLRPGRRYMVALLEPLERPG